MDESLRWRRMQADDLPWVVQIETRAYAFPWTIGMFASCLDDQQYECWAAERWSELVGYGVLSVGADEAHLLNVCVARDHQGDGLGRLAMLHLISRARRRKAKALFLEVRPSNMVAIALYESLGFVEIGVRKNYYPAALGHEDARVMALDLEMQVPDETL